jgi:polyribonucleotide nucleotidyltransferase
MDFIIAATEKNIMMVEGEAKECSEEDLVKVLEIAHDAIRIQIKAQQELRDLVGITAKREYTKPYTQRRVRMKKFLHLLKIKCMQLLKVLLQNTKEAMHLMH